MAAFLICGAQPAQATSLTLFVDGLSSGGGAIPANPGQTIDVAVGLDDVSEVNQYNLDIIFDTSELALSSAQQLACLSFSSGTCATVPPFTIDPTDANSAGGALGVRRAAVLTTPPGFFSIDTGATGEPISTFFSLTFTVLPGVILDGQPDVTIGILNSAANDITNTSAQSLIASLQASGGDTVSFSIVPEPSTVLLLGLALAGLGMRWLVGNGS